MTLYMLYFFSQVIPIRVDAVGQVNLLLAGTGFDLFFPGYGSVYAVCEFEVDELFDVVAFCEFATVPIFVFLNATMQVIGYAGVEDSVVFVGEDVDEVVLISCHCEHFLRSNPSLVKDETASSRKEILAVKGGKGEIATPREKRPWLAMTSIAAIKRPDHLANIFHIIIRQGCVHRQHDAAGEHFFGVRQTYIETQFLELVNGFASPLDQRANPVLSEICLQIISASCFEFVILVNIEMVWVTIWSWR